MNTGKSGNMLRIVLSLAWPTMLVGSSLSALGVGFLAYIARECGAKRYDNAARAAAQSVLAALVAGLAFTALALGASGAIPRWMNARPEIQAEASRYFFIVYTPLVFRSANVIFGMALRAAGDGSGTKGGC